MGNWGLTSQGFIVPGVSDVVSALQQDMRGALGPNLNFLPGSNWSVVLGVLGIRLQSAWDAGGQTFQYINPDNASGQPLDNAVAMNGVFRQGATKSKQTVQYFFGTAGTPIPALTRLSVAGNPAAVFQTDNAVTLIAGSSEVQHLTPSATPASGTFKLQFTRLDQTLLTAALNFNCTAGDIQSALQALGNIGSGNVAVTGSWGAGFTVTFQGALALMPQTLLVVTNNSLQTSAPAAVTITVSETTQGVPQGQTSLTALATGPTAAPAGTLTTLVNPIAGVTSTLNPQDAIAGTNPETDAAIKIRRRSQLALAASSTVAAITSKLLQVAGVTSVIVFENAGDTVDGSGRPPHSFECFIEGGTDADIAAALWTNKPAGIQLYGGIATTFTDSTGTVRNLAYSRPTVVQIYANITLTTNANFPSTGHVAAQTAIVNYINGLGQGQSVIITPGLVSALALIPGITGVSVQIGTSPSPTGTSNIAIAANQVAQTQASQIAVTP